MIKTKNKTTPQERNPLIDSLPPFVEMADHPRRLAFNPLNKHTSLTEISEENRQSLLDDMDRLFSPTRLSIEAAVEVQSMIRCGYRDRRPLSPRYMATLYDQKHDGSFAAPGTNARILVFKGITGVGKDALANRICAQYPQIIDHEDGDAVGLKRYTQIVVLRVYMSSDGSRSGFQQEILSAIDRLLQTDYSTTLKARSVSERDVLVANLLKNLHVGLLVLQELQADNFAGSVHREVMLNLILRFVNLAIPIVCVGNPGAFEWISGNTQIWRRLHHRPAIIIHPAYGPDDPVWQQVGRSIWEYDLMPKRLPWSREVSKRFYMASGGFPGYASSIKQLAHKMAWARGLDCISLELLEEAANLLDPGIRRVIKAFTTRNWDLINDLDDTWIGHYRNAWPSNSKIKTTPDIKAIATANKSNRRTAKPEKTNILTDPNTLPEKDLRGTFARQQLLKQLEGAKLSSET